jgi:hypothetical protein
MSSLDKDGLSFFTEGANQEAMGSTSVFSGVPKNRLDRMLTYRGDDEVGVAQLSDLEELAPLASASHPSLSDGASEWQRAFILRGPKGVEESDNSAASIKVGDSRRSGFRSLLSWKSSSPSKAKTQDSKDAS